VFRTALVVVAVLLLQVGQYVEVGLDAFPAVPPPLLQVAQ
jgi:hypothetical protein